MNDRIVEWLNEVFDQDEVDTNYWLDVCGSVPTPSHELDSSIQHHKWMLADIESKRQLLAYLVDLEHKVLGVWWILNTSLPFQIMALAYRDRPGYQEAWKP